MELQSQLMLILQEDVQVRAPPVTLPRGVPKVSIFHPGYEKKYPPIFQFPALDDGGISYDVVYYACCIVTGNNWPSGDDEAKIGTDEFDAKAYPYLTKTNDHTAPAVDRPADGVLRGSRYFLYVPGYMDGGNEPYPITGTFRDWVYPHNKLPRPWRDVNIDPATPETMRMMTLMKESSSTTRYRDTSCRMTGGVLATEQSHLIPRAEAAWFNTNDMEAYMLDEFAQPAIDDLANTVLLRVDVHKLLDQKIIVPVPKMQNDLYQLVTNVLQYKQGTYSELVRVYHNRLYRPLEGVSPQYLFARFAWSLFSKETMPIFDVKRGNIAVLVRNETKEGEMVDENNNPILKRMVVSNRAQLGTSRK
ncbi:hypothetical protein GGR54DRAFT_645781 [Hypoxylon sp. NC1633]|nr:hypothetical protein GGR54DRAFT_645781 [Hypoxylon sp. NC1633]